MAYALPIVTLRGCRWYLDLRLRELRATGHSLVRLSLDALPDDEWNRIAEEYDRERMRRSLESR